MGTASYRKAVIMSPTVVNPNNPIWTARSAAGLSLRQLSEKSGVAAETLSRLENDQRKPQVRTLKKIADALGIPISTLTDGLTVEEITASIEEAATEGKVVVRVAYLEEIDNTYSLHQEGLRFPGKKVGSVELNGFYNKATLYECPN